MGKSKSSSKSGKKAAPQSGMVVKNTMPGGSAKGSSFFPKIANSFSAPKKGGAKMIPRKTQ